LTFIGTEKSIDRTPRRNYSMRAPEPVAPTSAGWLAELSDLNQIAYSVVELGYG
jgi:hypothetical protein